jgi:hypothetical protein
MANDQEDEFLWQDILSRLEQQTKPQGEIELLQRPGAPFANENLRVDKEWWPLPVRANTW